MLEHFDRTQHVRGSFERGIVLRCMVSVCVCVYSHGAGWALSQRTGPSPLLARCFSGALLRVVFQQQQQPLPSQHASHLGGYTHPGFVCASAVVGAGS